MHIIINIINIINVINIININNNNKNKQTNNQTKEWYLFFTVVANSLVFSGKKCTKSAMSSLWPTKSSAAALRTSSTSISLELYDRRRFNKDMYLWGSDENVSRTDIVKLIALLSWSVPSILPPWCELMLIYFYPNCIF